MSDGLSFGRLLVHLVLLGIGGGIFDTLLNAVVVQRYEERAVRWIALLHASVTVGAMMGPGMVAFLATRGGWTLGFRTTGVACLVLMVWAALVPLPAPSSARREPGSSVGARALLTPALAALCVVGFAYIGVEAAVTIFSVPYARDALGLDPARGQSSLSAFWGGLLMGRIVLSLLHGRADARLLSVSGVAAAVCVVFGVALGWPPLEILTALVGVCLGAVFPLMVAIAGRIVPEAAGTAVGVVAGLGSLGGFALPWLTGVIADSHSIATAIGSLSLWCLAIGAAGAYAHRATRRSPASPAATQGSIRIR